MDLQRIPVRECLSTPSPNPSVPLSMSSVIQAKGPCLLAVTALLRVHSQLPPQRQSIVGIQGSISEQAVGSAELSFIGIGTILVMLLFALPLSQSQFRQMEVSPY